MSEQNGAGGAPVTTTSAIPAENRPGVFKRILSGSVGRNLGLVIALLLLIIVGTITAGDRFASVATGLALFAQRRFAARAGR